MAQRAHFVIFAMVTVMTWLYLCNYCIVIYYEGKRMALSVGASTPVLCRAQGRRFEPRPTRFSSSLSFTLYCVHSFILSVDRGVWKRTK